jgi:regulation of enolase protein 1 (concanavalin A-like superfamily)
VCTEHLEQRLCLSAAVASSTPKILAKSTAPQTQPPLHKLPSTLATAASTDLTSPATVTPATTVGNFTTLANGAPGVVGTMMLMPDGSVIASINAPSTEWARLVPDSHGSYLDGTWTVLASSSYTRLYDASQVLPDGRIFVAGGEYGTGEYNAETYNPVTNTWTTLSAPNLGGIVDAESILLPNGDILVEDVVPNTYGASMLFVPSTNTFTRGPTYAHGNYDGDEQSWVQLPDGSILAPDGTYTSERYIPSSNTWIADASSTLAFSDALGEYGSDILLPNGKVFVVGTGSYTQLYTPSGSTSPGTWSAGPTLPSNLGQDDAPMAVLPDGNVLFEVGPSDSYSGPSTFYIYNYQSNTLSLPTAPTASGPPYVSRFLDLPDGSCLISTGGSTLYEYNEGGTPLAAAQPTINSFTQNSNGTYALTGTLLNGLSVGASYGDDAQMATNWPLARFTSSGGLVYYGRTSNWTTDGDYTGSTVQSATITLPNGIPAGTYSVSVVTNGVASASVPVTIATTVQDSGPTITTAAHAGASPVTSTNTTLSVGVSDPNGASSLYYTWTTTSAPANLPLPSFSINGTNAASTTTATFYQAGSYTFKVTATDNLGLTTSSSVTVTVSQTDTQVKVSAASNTPTLGATDQFSGVSLDQFGNRLSSQPSSYSWSIISGPGSINTSTGLFTVPSVAFTSTIHASDGTATGSDTVGEVASPWTTVDIDSPSIAGSAYESGSTFSISSSGDGIGGTADQFTYDYIPFSGNGTITAEITSQTFTDPNAQVGVMVRASTASNAIMADEFFTPPGVAGTPTAQGVGLNYYYRTSTSGNVSSEYYTAGYDGLPAISAPYWVRLVVSGSTVTAYHSANGSTWVSDGSSTLSLGSTYDIGLAVSSSNSSLLSTATFSNVSVTPASLPAWLSATSAAVWNATTNTLTLNGAATIVADPGTAEPLIVAGGSVDVLTINPTSGTDIHLGGLTLTSGASAVETSLGSARSITNYHLLVIGTPGATTAPTYTIDATSTLDLQDNDMTILYGTGTSPLPQVQEQLQSAYDSAKWDRPGLTSTIAPSTHGATALGYATSSELGVTTFDGLSLGGNAVLVKYTLVGDTTLSGTVSGGDYNTVLNNYDVNGDWIQGNFVYTGTYSGGTFTNGQTNGTDYNAILANYDASLAGGLPGVSGPALTPALASALSTAATSSTPTATTSTVSPKPATATRPSKPRNGGTAHRGV